MQVAPSSSFRPLKAPGTAVAGAPLLDPAGPRVILGWTAGTLAAPISPSRTALFGPRGVCFHPDGSFWVSDTGHHRLLGWAARPESDGRPADVVIGQRDFHREGRNAKGRAGPATLNVPTGVCAWGRGLALADAWNHRVLLWRERPSEMNRPADIVLGQADPAAVSANRGGDRPSAETLYWPYGVAAGQEKLIVADTGNRRVLIWNRPERTGQPADIVLGQTDFAVRDENAGAAVGPAGMRWPHGVAFWDGRLVVADAGNNRIMVWEQWPDMSGAPCDCVLGQADCRSCDHNQAAYYPTASTLNMPYAVASAGDELFAADTANSRLVGWSEAVTGTGADKLTGQPDFASKGDNRWGMAGRDTLCWPYGLAVAGRTAAIADSGNNRVLLWDVAP